MFFTPEHAEDDEYNKLRDDPRLSEHKTRIEQLWVVHEPYADNHFFPEAKYQLHPRIWEMVVTNTFVSKEYILQKNSDEGPEFFIEISGKRFWVEAIAPGPGEGRDVVPPPQDIRSNEMQEIPNEKIILRLTNAVYEKLEKYEKAKGKDIIWSEDGYILAINGYKALNGWTGLSQETNDELSVIVKAVFPIGRQFVSWNTNPGEIHGEGFAYRPEIPKESGSPVSTCWFKNEKCKVISAIIYSEYGLLDLPQNLGSEFIFIHNPLANHLLNLNAFEFGHHYWLEGDQLKQKRFT